MSGYDVHQSVDLSMREEEIDIYFGISNVTQIMSTPGSPTNFGKHHEVTRINNLQLTGKVKTMSLVNIGLLPYIQITQQLGDSSK